MIQATGRIPKTGNSITETSYYGVVVRGREFLLYDMIRLYLRHGELVCGEIVSISHNCLDLWVIGSTVETFWFKEIVSAELL